MAFTIGFIMLWSKNNAFSGTPVISKTIRCWKEGNIVCPDDDALAVRDEFFDAVNEQTPAGARILSDDLAVRYYSLRPLAFSKKDGATFSFSNHAALLDWYQYAQIYDELWPLRDDWDAYIDAYTNFARLVEAEYLVIEQAYSQQDYYPAGLELVFSNEGYSLFAIQEITD